MRIRMLDAIQAHLYLARHYEWDKFLQYHEQTGPWSPEHEAALERAIKRYKEDGIDEEAGDCGSTSELEELRDGLVALQKERGLSLEREISHLEYRLADREEETSDHSAYAPRQFSSERKAPEPANDDEIRGLFRTLID